jgi:AraC-like DNA-binding protein
MLPLNAFFLIGNTALLVLLAIILVKDHYRQPSAVLGAILALGAAAMGMINVIVAWEWWWLAYPLNYLQAAIPVAFWLLAKSLFEDDFRWKWSHLLLYAVSLALGTVGHYITFGDFLGMVHWIMRSEVAHGGLALLGLVLYASVFVVMAMYSALKDWRTDLVESRRRVRTASVIVAATVILLISAVEFLSLGTPRSALLDTAVSGMFFALILGICVRFLGFRREPASQTVEHVFPSETPEEAEAREGGQGAIVVGELKRLMEEEKVFREEGITIRRLAEKLNVREYRLRRLINGHLGYRNFNSFLNRYRIEEVARQLLAPETRHLPVLSIALDMGYRSLSPFNKAFREIKGMTPTEYRNCYGQGMTASAD